MNGLDIMFLVAFIPFLLNGLLKGFVRQIIALVSLFVAARVSLRFSALLGGILSRYMDLSSNFLYIIAFVLIFCIIMVLFAFLSKGLRGIIRLTMLQWLDVLLGLVFSFLKAVVILGIIVIVFDVINSKFAFVAPSILAESKIYVFLKHTSLNLFPYFQKLIVK